MYKCVDCDDIVSIKSEKDWVSFKCKCKCTVFYLGGNFKVIPKRMRNET